MSAVDERLVDEQLQRARAIGVLISSEPGGHVVYRRWSAECTAEGRADLQARLMPRTVHVFGDTSPMARELDADGASWIAEIAPKTGWVKGFAFKGVSTFEFRVPRTRLDEVAIVLGCIARSEGTQPFFCGDRPLATVLPIRGSR